MNKFDLEVMNRMRNKATQELSIKLKRMPTDDEITMEVCRWIANAYTPVTTQDWPAKSDMVNNGYWDKDEE